MLFRSLETGAAGRFDLHPAAAEAEAQLRLVQDPAVAAEGYRLRVDRRGIEIAAADAAGIFYGMQSLLEMADRFGGRTVFERQPRLYLDGYQRAFVRRKDIDLAHVCSVIAVEHAITVRLQIFDRQILAALSVRVYALFTRFTEHCFYPRRRRDAKK